MFQIVFDEIKTKVLSARICKIDATGSLYVIERERERDREREREREGVTYTKKVKSTQISTTLQSM